jgi:hypothetical protein
MKRIAYFSFVISLLFIFLVRCKNVLDIAPENIIQDDQLFSSETGVEAYMASLYNAMPIEDFTLQPSGRYFPHISGEALHSGGDRNDIGNGTSLQWFRYDFIRNVNNFLIKLPNYTFPEAKMKAWLGEAKFIRAYYYFGLVKRYGGMPLITSLQDYSGSNLEELKVRRNTEKELWDFVSKELDSAAQLLPVTAVRGRATNTRPMRFNRVLCCMPLPLRVTDRFS